MLNPNSINDKIKGLITCYLTGDIDRAQLEELNRWMNESEDHKEIFNTFKSTWILSGMTNTKDKFFVNQTWGNLQKKLDFEMNDSEQESNLKRIIIFKKLRTAAIWLLFFGLGSFITYLVSSNRVTQNFKTEITVPYGTKTTAKLPDGSTVYLNAGSTIIYNQDFNKTKRLVYLSGEAYFNVATNKSKPFEVITSFLTVRATGTKFNVKAYPNESSITATLVEGKIDIRNTNAQTNSNRIELKPKQCFVFYKADVKDNPSPQNIIYPNQVSVKNNDENLNNYKVYNNVKTELYTSWSEENWVIESETLRTFAPKIERRFNMVIHFKDEEIKDYKFSATIQKETIEQILQAIKIATPMINYKIVKDTINFELDRKIKQHYEK